MKDKVHNQFEAAEKILVAEFGAKLTKSTSRVDKPNNHIFSFPNFGNYQLSMRNNKKTLSIYVNAKTRLGDSFESKFIGKATVVKRYPQDGNPSSLLLSAQDAPFLTPTKNDLLLIEVEKFDSLVELVGLYLDVAPSSAITNAVQEEFERDTERCTTGERDALVKVRFGQGIFRDALIRKRGANCWMSNIEGKPLLIASHIKPWSKCKTDTEARGNLDNGLLLSALWDAAFDAGLISFGEDWKIICSERLSESAKNSLGINITTSLPDEFRNDARKNFLTFHRENCFLD